MWFRKYIFFFRYKGTSYRPPHSAVYRSEGKSRAHYDESFRAHSMEGKQGRSDYVWNSTWRLSALLQDTNADTCACLMSVHTLIHILITKEVTVLHSVNSLDSLQKFLFTSFCLCNFLYLLCKNIFYQCVWFNDLVIKAASMPFLSGVFSVTALAWKGYYG